MPSKKVIPSSSRIKFKCKNNFERKVIRKTELQLIINRVRYYNQKIEYLNEEIRTRRNSLRSSLNDNENAQVNRFLMQSKEKTFKHTGSNQIKKLSNL